MVKFTKAKKAERKRNRIRCKINRKAPGESVDSWKSVKRDLFGNSRGDDRSIILNCPIKTAISEVHFVIVTPFPSLFNCLIKNGKITNNTYINLLHNWFMIPTWPIHVRYIVLR